MADCYDRGAMRPPEPANFRWRGERMSRIEALSDAVFAFAVTLLIVSLDPPTSFQDLTAALARFPGFAISFLFLLIIWYQHYLFFRRYGLRDTKTVWLNGMLLFVVLFYVYPLRFLMALLAQIFGGGGDWSVLRNSEWQWLMVIYGVGFMAVYGLLAAMVAHAKSRGDELQLTAVEMHETRSLIGTHLIQVGAGAVSVVLALTLPRPFGIAVAGWVYGMLFPAHLLHQRRRNRTAPNPATSTDQSPDGVQIGSDTPRS